MIAWIQSAKSAVKIFSFDIKEWLPPQDILFGLVIASLMINILSLVFPLSLLQIYDRIIPNQASSTLFYLMLAVAVAMLIEMLMKLARSYVSAWGDAKLGFKSASKAFNHLLNTRLDAYEKIGSGVHLNRINALNRVKDFYGGQALTALIDIPFVVTYFVIISMIHPVMLLVPMGLQALLVIAAILKGQDHLKTLQHRAQTNEKKSNYIIEVLGGIHTIKSQGMEKLILSRYERLQKTTAIDDFAFSQSSGSYQGLGNLASQLNLVFVVFVGSVLVIEHQMTPGGVAACILLSSRSMIPFVKFIGLWSRFQSIKLAQTKYESILALPTLPSTSEKQTQIEKGEIELVGIDFQFEDSSQKVFEHMNLHIKPGEMVHIKAQGTIGKSTLLLLIKGLLLPNKGQVLIDGRPIQDYDTQTLGKHIAYIPQDSNLFHGTILENLTLFRNAQYAEKAKQLAKGLDLDTVIEQMPQGYDTIVGQGSVDFVSKGIKQRIIILRSLINDPKIILFDEANSAMDIASDKKLHTLLKNLCHQSTILLVTHRPSLIALADRSLVIQNRTIQEATDAL